MFSTIYNRLVDFVSQDNFVEALKTAKVAYFTKTGGELLSNQDEYENRMNGFLEWFIFDRPFSDTEPPPVKMYLEQHKNKLGTIEQDRLVGFTEAKISVFEYIQMHTSHLEIINLLNDKKYYIYERRRPILMKKKDIFIARTVPYDDKMIFSFFVEYVPNEVNAKIVEICKNYKKASYQENVDFIFRILFFVYRSRFYKHVPLDKIFADLK